METLTHVRLLQRKQILKEWRQEVNENSLFCRKLMNCPLSVAREMSAFTPARIISFLSSEQEADYALSPGAM
ncbi:MAG: hypothetical protein KTQ49_06675, partial [Candidatus Omnitrophica bacterium]|nr:hypothetical protein [Candidatus Omnitrophota bacterium]